jgi:hypothetical protein
LRHTGGLRPGHGGPPSGPASAAYASVTVVPDGFWSSRHGDSTDGGAVDEVGSQVTCGSPTPPVASRPASGTYTRSVNTPVGFFAGSTWIVFGPGLSFGSNVMKSV